MKKELLVSVLLASVSLAASFNLAAQWQDTSNDVAEAPPEELAAAAAAAAPGAIPVKAPEKIPAKVVEPPAFVAVAAVTAPAPSVAPVPVPTPTQLDGTEAVAAEVLPAPVLAPPADEIRSVTPVVSTWNTSKATAVVMRPVPLRTRPVTTGAGDIVDAETRVRLESSTINGDGTWWYVTAPGIGGGWLLENEMGSPQR